MSALSARDNAARGCARVGILTFVASLLTLGVAAAQTWQSPDGVRSAARELVLRTVGEDSGATVEAVGVDERLKLPACAAALQTEWQRPLRAGQGVVAVSCPTGDSWRLFVPVRAVEQVAVVAAARSLQAGEIVAASDLVRVTKPSSSLPYEYVTSFDQAVGRTVRRTLPPGTILVSGALERAEIIERGAIVTLVSGSGPVLVRSEGVALEPAGLKQRVRVRSRSGRIVEGVVEPSGEVRVGL
jgi:flagellar basal body P-ring formation protein FlgA